MADTRQTAPGAEPGREPWDDTRMALRGLRGPDRRATDQRNAEHSEAAQNHSHRGWYPGSDEIPETMRENPLWQNLPSKFMGKFHAENG